MRVWRLCAKHHWKFDGGGARNAGGRWNSAGYAVVYTSAAISLAALEFLVHLGRNRSVKDLVLVSAEIPDGLTMERVDVSALPSDWRRYPAPDYLQTIGNAWIDRSVATVLAVPSAVIPQETNYLLNPAHPDFRRIRIGRPAEFSLDFRLAAR